MFNVIFSLYYELCPWHSCRSYCLNKFDTSNRVNYFQSIPKYFLECTIWHASHYTGYTFFLFMARGIILISRAWRTWICYYYYAYACYCVYYMRCFNFKYRQYNNRGTVNTYVIYRYCLRMSRTHRRTNIQCRLA